MGSFELLDLDCTITWNLTLELRYFKGWSSWWGLEAIKFVWFWVWFPNPEIGNRIIDSLSSIKTYSSNFSSSLHIFWHKNNKKSYQNEFGEFCEICERRNRILVLKSSKNWQISKNRHSSKRLPIFGKVLAPTQNLVWPRLT